MDYQGLSNIAFGLENCETILVPYQCFQNLAMQINDDGDIAYFECHIIDNGLLEYSFTYDGNTTAPIARLHQYNDITSISLIYDDHTDYYPVLWGDDDYCQSNERQLSVMPNYKEINILIKDLPDSDYITDLFALLDSYEDCVTVKQIRDGLMTLDIEAKRHINNCASLICALRQ